MKLRHLIALSLFSLLGVGATGVQAQTTPQPSPQKEIESALLEYRAAFNTHDRAVLKRRVTPHFFDQVGGEDRFFARLKMAARISRAETTSVTTKVDSVTGDTALAGFQDGKNAPWAFFRLKKDPKLGWQVDSPVESQH